MRLKERKPYADEFKAQVVELMAAGKPVTNPAWGKPAEKK